MANPRWVLVLIIILSLFAFQCAVIIQNNDHHSDSSSDIRNLHPEETNISDSRIPTKSINITTTITTNYNCSIEKTGGKAVWCNSRSHECKPSVCSDWIVQDAPNRGRPRVKRWIGDWIKKHEKLKTESHTVDSGMWFLGDSLTENLRNDSKDNRSASSFNELFSSVKPLALGIGGDETQNLIWRILHGELPSSRHPNIIILLIGTNNLNHCNGDKSDLPLVATSIVSVVHLLMYRYPSMHIVTLGILPRDDSCYRKFRKHNWRCSLTYQSMVTMVNEIVEKEMAGLSNVKFLDCGSVLFPREPQYYDKVHLNPQGYFDLWEKCLIPYLINRTGFVSDKFPLRFPNTNASIASE